MLLRVIDSAAFVALLFSGSFFFGDLKLVTVWYFVCRWPVVQAANIYRSGIIAESLVVFFAFNPDPTSSRMGDCALSCMAGLLLRRCIGLYVPLPEIHRLYVGMSPCAYVQYILWVHLGRQGWR